MKAKIRSLGKIVIPMVIILIAYLVNTNVTISDKDNEKGVRATPNYIEIKDDVAKVEESTEVAEEELVVEDPIVYDNKTLNELAQTINNSLNSDVSDKGYLIVSYSLEKGVDPYMATAIMLHETGCKHGCSRLVYECNNVGGQKGYGCGSYAYFNTLDEGIKAFIDNLERNYISYGLTTPEQINPKYAEDPNWANQVNKYIEQIKAQ